MMQTMTPESLPVDIFTLFALVTPLLIWQSWFKTMDS